MSRRVQWLCLLLPAALVACAGLLGIRKSPQRPFEHHTHVVKGIACVQCHVRVASGDPNAPLDLPTTASCLQCHKKPHETRECSDCHGREQDRRDAAQAKLHLRFSHRDHKGTEPGRCTRCHQAVLHGDGPLRPPMAACLGCHEHRDQWSARACSPCHVRMEAEGTRPASHVVHGSDFMKRHGLEAATSRDLCTSCHAESSCAACHGGGTVPALPSTWHFDEPRRPDMHAAGFFARHSLEARTDPALCTSCHRDEQECRDCHRARGLLEVTPEHGSPHPAGWVGTRSSENRHGIEARSNPVSCASCHGGAGESLCVGCHRVGGPGGNPHPPGFSSRKPRSDLPCRLCHTEGP
jgi:hypothetical protein